MATHEIFKLPKFPIDRESRNSFQPLCANFLPQKFIIIIHQNSLPPTVLIPEYFVPPVMRTEYIIMYRVHETLMRKREILRGIRSESMYEMTINLRMCYTETFCGVVSFVENGSERT